LSYFGSYVFDVAEVLLANLASVGVSESGVAFLGLGAEEAVGQDRFKLTNAEPCTGHGVQKLRYAGRGKGFVDRLLDIGEGLFVLDRDGGLLEHGCVTSLRDQSPRILRLIWKAKAVPFQDSTFSEVLERETGIEPATNSLEGCDSTTELLPPAKDSFSY
jgi:hypothetical protein